MRPLPLGYKSLQSIHPLRLKSGPRL
jgi:hypothetical protein